MKSSGGFLKQAYILVTAGVGVWVLLTNFPTFRSSSELAEYLFMFILVAIGEVAPVTIPRGSGTVSVSPPMNYTVTVLCGPAAGIWVNALATLRKRDFSGQVPLKLVLFNRGMLAISMFMFSKAYAAMGGHFGTLEWPRGYVAFLTAAIVDTLCNALQFSVYFSLDSGMSLRGVWRLNIQWSLPSMLALYPLGILMILVAQEAGPFLLTLFYLPLLTMKYSLTKYIELRLAYHEMAGALSNAIDARDAYTRGHSERVAEYAALLAKGLKLTEDRIEMIRYVGLLHDVGKIGIRDAIMKKQGTYTYEEYEEMKKHSVMGSQMLEGMKFIGKGQDWVKHHHERWDGRGFPDGLKGEEIPLEARIIACADSFDAMTTDRPYKAKLTILEAKEELARCAGTQFDPEVVKAMLKVVDRMISAGM
ncbi:MAG: HD-GYP domain-containing protein [Bacillota bacterium]|nr:HD-GYP domain-containing protein [Candidatus Fermentithermobacillaceae bacterium]